MSQRSRLVAALAGMACIVTAALAAGVREPAARGLAAGNVSAAASGCGTKPSLGGSLVVGHQYDVANLNPLVSSNNGEILVQTQIFSGLIRADPTGKFKLVAGLADRWSVSSNGLVYSFHIRKNAHFSNGKPVTAADVKFSIDRFANPKLNQIFPSLATEIGRTVVSGARTVQVHLKVRSSAFLQYMSLFPAFIVPKALVQAEGDSKFFSHPVGAGPFKVTQWAKGSSITLTRNPYYWENGKPYLNKLTYQFITDDNTRILKLRAGEIGLAEGIPFTQIASLSHVNGLRIQRNASTRQEVIWFNLHHAPLNDVKVRQALSLAIDRKALNSAVYAGTGEIPNSEFPKLQYNDNSIPRLATDLAKARSLMAQSSTPKGFSMTMLYPAGNARIEQLLTIVQQEWSAIGVTIKLQPIDQATLKSKLHAEDYDMMVQQDLWSSDILAPDEFAFVFADTTKNGIDGYFSGFQNQQIWALVQKAGTATEAQRAALWPQIQKLWLTEMPWMSVMWLPTVTGIRSNVCNVPVNALGWYEFESSWVAKG